MRTGGPLTRELQGKPVTWERMGLLYCLVLAKQSRCGAQAQWQVVLGEEGEQSCGLRACRWVNGWQPRLQLGLQCPLLAAP